MPLEASAGKGQLSHFLEQMKADPKVAGYEIIFIEGGAPLKIPNVLSEDGPIFELPNENIRVYEISIDNVRIAIALNEILNGVPGARERQAEAVPPISSDHVESHLYGSKRRNAIITALVKRLGKNNKGHPAMNGFRMKDLRVVEIKTIGES